MSYYQTLIRGRSIRCFKRKTCTYSHEDEPKTSLMRILDALSGAKRIDLCIFRFSLEPLADFLIEKHKLGTIIRVICDAGRFSSEKDQIPKLIEAGIEVRERRRNQDDEGDPLNRRPLMHNKFVLIDDKTCFLGSFNWTYSATLKNHETILRNSEPQIIRPLRRKFLEIWNSI